MKKFHGKEDPFATLSNFRQISAVTCESFTFKLIGIQCRWHWCLHSEVKMRRNTFDKSCTEFFMERFHSDVNVRHIDAPKQWCFHVTSRQPYWCPKTMKRRPCWCFESILWELNSFLCRRFPLFQWICTWCWPREQLLVNKNENVSTLTTRMFSWTPSKFFNSRRQTLNLIAVTSSAHTLVASWIFLGGSVWTAVRNTFGLLPENWKSKEIFKRWWTVELSLHLDRSSITI